MRSLSVHPAKLKWNVKSLLVDFLATLVIVFAASRGQAEPSEPVSHGHPLSYWLEHCMPGGNAEQRQLAEAAVREIGTNGLPALLVWLRYEPSQTKTEVMDFLKRIRQSAYGRWIPAELTYERGPPPAHIGFNVLGPAAAPAIPELEHIANDAQHPRPAARAMMALSAIGPAALPAVEARLANTNFPFPPDAAVNMYLRTRTSSNYHQLSAAAAKPILLELQTNPNPLLVKGATQILKLMEQPSFWERRQNKTLSEAMLDMQTERQTGAHLKPGWNIHPRDRLSREEQLVASNAVAIAMTSPPALPNGDEPYPYPLQSGTAAWNYATVEERLQSIEIPKSWRKHATSWQLFRSAIGNPYFRTVYLPGYDIADCYKASRSGTVSILQEVDTSPDFGTNVLRWISELDLAKMAASEGDKPYEPCSMDYVVVCHMASLDSALGTLDVSARQRLYRLAVWDADYFLSRKETMVASGPVGLIYAIARKPESFRGALPPAAVLLPSPPQRPPVPGLAEGFMPDPVNLGAAITRAKAALGLKDRP